MVDIFESAAKNVRNSYTVIWIFLMSALMLAVGVNHFWEDTLSSRYGIGQLEVVLGLVPVSYDLTYWTMSLAPQVAQVVFGYLFLNNTKKNLWALAVFVLALLIDFFADSWYRSGQGLFDSPEKLASSVLLTLAYFTVGSEGFITIGFGMVAELILPTGVQVKRLLGQVWKALETYAQPTAPPKDNRQGGRNQQTRMNYRAAPDQLPTRPPTPNGFHHPVSRNNGNDEIPHLHDTEGWKRFIVRLQMKPKGESSRILERMTHEQRQKALSMLRQYEQDIPDRLGDL